MESQRRFIHPHNPNIMVIDVLNEKGQMIRTKNFVIKRDPNKYCHHCWETDLGGCTH